MAFLNLSDFIATGQTVADSDSDTMLATVVVETTAKAGDLTLSFDGTALELLDPNLNPVSGFSDLQANLNSFNPATVIAQTPEPSTFVLLGAAAICLIGYGSWRRRQEHSLSRAAGAVSGNEHEDSPAILSLPSLWTRSARRAA